MAENTPQSLEQIRRKLAELKAGSGETVSPPGGPTGATGMPQIPAGAPGNPKKETGRIQPKKETVKINLPPRPLKAPTIKLPTLPPGVPSFHYKGIDDEGIEREGDIQATDGNSARAALRSTRGISNITLVVQTNLPPKPTAAPTIKLPTLPPGGPAGASRAKAAPEEGAPEIKPAPPEEIHMYRYLAMDATGREAKGTLEVKDQNEAITRIKEMGLYPIKLIAVPKDEIKGTKPENRKGRKSNFIKKALIYGTAGLISFFGGKPLGQWAGKLGQESPDQKATENYSAKQMKEFYQSKAKSIHEENIREAKLAKSLSTNTIPDAKIATPTNSTATYTTNATNEEIRERIKELQDRDTKQQEELKAAEEKYKKQLEKHQLAQIALSNQLAAIEKTQSDTKRFMPKEEIEARRYEAEIKRARINEAEIEAEMKKAEIEGRTPDITGDQAMLHNWYIQQPKNPKTPKPKAGAFTSGSGSAGVSFEDPSQAPTEKLSKNPLQLSPEMLAEAKTMHRSNLSTVYSGISDGTKIWNEIKTKDVHKFMNGKIAKKHNSLFSYLKKLEEKTGLSPELGEGVEQYIIRCLQLAANKRILPETAPDKTTSK